MGYALAVGNKMALGFFLSLARLIESSENSASCDTSEFLVRRLEEYERTLSTLIARFCEAYGQAGSQQTTGQLNHLLGRTTSLRAHFEQRCFVNWIEEDENERQNGVLIDGPKILRYHKTLNLTVLQNFLSALLRRERRKKSCQNLEANAPFCFQLRARTTTTSCDAKYGYTLLHPVKESISFCFPSTSFLVQSALLGWFGGLPATKALRH